MQEIDYKEAYEQEHLKSAELAGRIADLHHQTCQRHRILRILHERAVAHLYVQNWSGSFPGSRTIPSGRPASLPGTVSTGPSAKRTDWRIAADREALWQSLATRSGRSRP